MQSSWDTFTTIESAMSGTRGNTQQAVSLVKENLIVGEAVEWIATTSVNDLGNWHDGAIILTDQRVIVSYFYADLNMSYAHMNSRLPVPGIVQFQGEGWLTTFQIHGIPLQAVAMPEATLNELRQRLESAKLIIEVDDGFMAPANEDPVETLSTLKKLLEQDLITQAEYDAKKTEILARM